MIDIAMIPMTYEPMEGVAVKYEQLMMLNNKCSVQKLSMNNQTFPRTTKTSA